MLWTMGASLLHSGVVVNGKEYAYGGHDRPGVTGVYWTAPKSEPPGGFFKMEILHGFTFATQAEIDNAIRQTSDEFLGTSYNLLHKNCNHFTSSLVQKLTNRPGPAWLNRAASIGIALPCIVPRDWVEPPDYCDNGGELVYEESEDDEGLDDHEGSRMLRPSGGRPSQPVMGSLNYASADDDEDAETEPERGTRRQSLSSQKSRTRDTSGRVLPPAERMPTGSRR